MSKRLRLAFHRFLVNFIANSVIIPSPIRYILYRIAGLRIETKNILSGCTFSSWRARIGHNTFVNQGVYFETSAEIDIGKNCDIGMQAMFCSSTHEPGDSSRRAGKPTGKPIKIGDGTWIGARAMILPGVTVGEGCVIAAGSVVTKDCEPNSMYAGVPAKKVRELDTATKLHAI